MDKEILIFKREEHEIKEGSIMCRSEELELCTGDKNVLLNNVLFQKNSFDSLVIFAQKVRTGTESVIRFEKNGEIIAMATIYGDVKIVEPEKCIDMISLKQM